MKKTYWGIKLSCSFYLYRFRKYVSYGFPLINFCVPGVHYETPRIILGLPFGVFLTDLLPKQICVFFLVIRPMYHNHLVFWICST